jgi:hypothetical protein
MSATGYLKGGCEHCGGHIEFPADGIGSTANCPHCGVETELRLAEPELEESAPQRSRWITVGVIILGGGLLAGVGGVWATRFLAAKAQPAARNASVSAAVAPSTAAPMWSSNEFVIGSVRIERRDGSTLRYAVGTLRNEAERQRFGVTVELEILDATGASLGTTKDYRDVLEPRAEWSFKALVPRGNPASARIVAVREQT